MSIRKCLFRIARSAPMGCLIGKVAQYCPFIVPAHRIHLDNWVAAFHHPVPSYQNHAVFLPRKWIPSILQMTDEERFLKLLQAAEQVSNTSEWAGRQLLFCANAGRRQDVGQLHFHLVSLRDASGYDEMGTEPVLRKMNGCILCGNGKRFWLRPVSEEREHSGWKDLFAAAMAFCQEAAREMDLSREGFSIRILKRPDRTAFEQWVCLDFDRPVTERRTDYESGSHL